MNLIRRRAVVVGLLCAVVCGPAAPPVRADGPPPAQPAPPAASTVSAAVYYRFATDHLKQGRWFERSARQLRAALSQEPGNADFHLALGCALADRAAALAYAASFTDMLRDAQNNFPREQAAWEAAQNDPKADEHGLPRPVAPPEIVFPTKDDGEPLRLSPSEARARVAALSTEAQTEWETAARLSTTGADRAEIANVRGWGLRLLRRYVSGLFAQADSTGEDEDGPPKPASPAAPKGIIPPREQILTLFTSATELAPDNPVYWQSLGDALLGEIETPAADRTRAKDAYLRSLALQKRNAGLWFRLYELEARTPTIQPESAGDAAKAETYLRNATLADGGNAYPFYQLAALQFRAVNYSDVYKADRTEERMDRLARDDTDAARKVVAEAIALMERGNAAPRYQQPLYEPPIPALLAAAWNYNRWDSWWDGSNLLDYGARLRELARAACGYALIASRQKNTSDAVRAARATIRMGYKLIGDWPVKDQTRGGGEIITSLVGSAVAAIGYGALQQVYEQAGNTVAARQLAEEQSVFRARSKERSRVLLETMDDRVYEDY